MVIFLSNSQSHRKGIHFADVHYNNYAVYDGDAQETEYLEFRPLIRQRRNDDSYDTEESKLKVRFYVSFILEFSVSFRLLFFFLGIISEGMGI